MTMSIRVDPWLCRCCETVVPYAVIITVIQFNMAWMTQGAAPKAPTNLTVTYVTNNFAIATWRYTGGADQPVSKFEMTICPTQSRSRTSSRAAEKLRYCMLIPRLEPYLTSVRLEKLEADTVYVLYMTAVYGETYSNKSNNVSFTTVSDSGVFRAGDACVVLIVVVMWIIAVVLFLQKWGSIRIVQPRELRYKFKPKNLDTVKVVKRATDSVIYKGYNRQLSFTMEKREQKLERMNTLQAIQIEQQEREKAEREMKLKQMTRKERREERESEKQREALVKEQLKEAREKMREKEKELDRKLKEKQREKENEREKVRLEREENLRLENKEKVKLKEQSSLPIRIDHAEKVKLKGQMSLNMENIAEKNTDLPEVKVLGNSGSGWTSNMTSVQIETAESSKLSDSAIVGNTSLTSISSEQLSLELVNSEDKVSGSAANGKVSADSVIHEKHDIQKCESDDVMTTTT